MRKMIIFELGKEMEKDVCLSCRECSTKKNSSASMQISYTKCDTNKIEDPNSMHEACHT